MKHPEIYKLISHKIFNSPIKLSEWANAPYDQTGFRPEEIPTLKAAIDRGLVPASPDELPISGQEMLTLSKAEEGADSVDAVPADFSAAFLVAIAIPRFQSSPSLYQTFSGNQGVLRKNRTFVLIFVDLHKIGRFLLDINTYTIRNKRL